MLFVYKSFIPFPLKMAGNKEFTVSDLNSASSDLLESPTLL